MSSPPAVCTTSQNPVDRADLPGEKVGVGRTGRTDDELAAVGDRVSAGVVLSGSPGAVVLGGGHATAADTGALLGGRVVRPVTA